MSAKRDSEKLKDLRGNWRAARRDELEPASKSRADLFEDELVVDVERAGKRGFGRVELGKGAFKGSARERALEAWSIQCGSLTSVQSMRQHMSPACCSTTTPKLTLTTW